MKKTMKKFGLLWLILCGLMFVACGDSDSDDSSSNNSVTTEKPKENSNVADKESEENTGTNTKDNSEDKDNNSKKTEPEFNENSETDTKTSDNDKNQGKSSSTESSSNTTSTITDSLTNIGDIIKFSGGTSASTITDKILELSEPATLKFTGPINAVMLKKIAAALQENDSVKIALDFSNTTGIIEWKEWFTEITTLYAISLPTTTTKINDEAFKGCSLSSLTIPESVTEVCSMPDSVENVNYLGNIEKYLICSDLARRVRFSNSLLYINGKKANEITNANIPESVTDIPDFAFYNWTSLKTVTIPTSVKVIGESAFEGCESLTMTTLNLPNLEKLKQFAFHDITTLENIYVGENLVYIDTRAFCGCINLKEASFGNYYFDQVEYHTSSSTLSGSISLWIIEYEPEENAEYLIRYSKSGSYYLAYNR